MKIAVTGDTHGKIEEVRKSIIPHQVGGLFFTGDFYGPKNLGFNYGLVFIGWGAGFFMARIGGWIKDITGSLDNAFYISGVLLILGVIVAKINKRPSHADKLSRAQQRTEASAK